MPNPHNSPVLRGGRGFEKGQEAARALPPQDDQLMSQRDKLEF
jgi:hypothetical protein